MNPIHLKSSSGRDEVVKIRKVYRDENCKIVMKIKNIVGILLNVLNVLSQTENVSFLYVFY